MSLTITHDQRLIVCRAMKEYGGSFVKALGNALLHADQANIQIICVAFDRKYDSYFPGGDFYNSMQRVVAEEV